MCAGSVVQRHQLDVSPDASLSWFKNPTSERHASRAFCCTCGSNLFWVPEEGHLVCIAAGTLDQPSGLKRTRHLFVSQRADYWSYQDDLPGAPEASAWRTPRGRTQPVMRMGLAIDSVSDDGGNTACFESAHPSVNLPGRH
ncbi:GFA family protein [Rhodococcus qingshengii]|uniref:GFA family protein n=1 Tax=Rhodococcus qingshengii TaxID=334542 RepID=UPI003556EE88